MKDSFKKNKPNKNPKKALLLETCVFGLTCIMLIWVNVLAFKTLILSLSNTSEMYSIMRSPIPQDVMDDFKKIIMQDFIISGTSGAAIMAIFMGAVLRWRRLSARIREIQLETPEAEKKEDETNA